MYCDKLTNIVQSKESEKYFIEEPTIKKLDIFIKRKTTIREREKINPMKFSVKMNVEQETALMVFIIGTQLNLFKARKYYSCQCGEHFEFENTSQPVYCLNCEEVVSFYDDRNRISLYFSLLEIPAACCWDHKEDIYPLDYLESYNENFTLADLDEISEEGEYDNLIGLKTNRESIMQEYLQGDSTSEFN